MSQRPNARCPIAIVGASALFPGSVDKTGFWNDILAGSDLISDVPKTHWLIDDYFDDDLKKPDHTYASRGGFLKDIPFDALSWGVPPSILSATDTSQLLALVIALRVLEDAHQGQFANADKSRTSVILGVTSSQELLGSMVSRLQHPIWRKSMREAGLPESEVNDIVERISSHYATWQESTFPGLLGNVVAGRIANRLDLGGTNCVTDAACASAFSAVSMAVNELYLGDSDMVVCGGVDTMNDIFMYMCFSKTPALSKSGDCRPFSAAGDGTMLGEGIGMVALKRLADAERDGDRIYGVIQGVGSSSDGRSKSVYAPVPKGQSKSILRAYERAGYDTSTVELVEAHGTGTVAGDAAEFGGLEIAFGESDTEESGWCALGSVKSQIGHTKAAAGSAGLFKAVMALHHKAIPPTIKVDAPNPKIDLDGPFYISTKTRPWVRDSSHPRRAGVSSFGFGGSNFHVAVEEYKGPNAAARLRTAPAEVVVLTADSPAALASQAAELGKQAATHGGNEHLPSFLAWLAHDSASKLDVSKPARVAILAKDDADLASKLSQVATLVAKQGETAISTPTGIHYAFGNDAGEVAFLFPGQGSQYVDMGSATARFFDEAIAAWDAAADVDLGTDMPLHGVVFPKPSFEAGAAKAQTALLTATEWAQPALGVSSVAMLSLLTKAGINPAMVGGHSYGEVTALHAAGVISYEDMVKVARKRGELMREAAKVPGSMCAVPLEVEAVRARLEEWGVDVVVANHNAPTQVVLSGTTEAIADVEKRFEGVGVTAKRLNVATAFHSSVVSPSTKPFGTFLDGVKFKKAGLPVYANSEAAPYPKTAKAMRKVLAGQIAKPVRFVEQVEAMYAAGARTFIEVGSGRVLSNLVGQILDGRAHTAVNLDHKRKNGVAALFEGLGRLAVAGVPVNLAALWERFAEPVDPRTIAKMKMPVDINGSNYGKPYPPADLSKLPGPNPERPKVAPVAAAPVKAIATPAAKPTPRPVPVAAPVAAKPAPRPVVAQPAPAPVAAPVVPTVVAAPTPASPAWLTAYTEAQRQTAEAHSAYQNAMADVHMAYLQSVETSFFGMTAMLQPGALPAPALPAMTASPAPAPVAARPVAAPTPMPIPVAAPVPVAAPKASPKAVPKAAAPVLMPKPIVPVSTSSLAGLPIMSGEMAAPKAAAKAAKPVAAPKPAGIDLTALLLEVVAEKTGYPSEMLSLEMELESDLGIDSIKRVEILSGMREKAPSLPEVDASEMAELQTLAQIVEYMGAQSPGLAAAPVAAAAPAASGIDLTALLLEVVAEKTGYPSEMLSLEMELESDLGIDSIKRVEILSGMREKAPSLPEVDASEMAELQTLAQIVESMGAQSPGLAAAPAPAAAPAASGIDLNALL
ncbi:MAG: acyltransferase domain-containing protein, partial [Proteobacteria bacterium]|nr:acyltransferase domain-containing protein [Pseudomonadota bacterium]